MKILACHNYYQSRGGEDISFDVDVEMLRSYGHEVETFTRHNDDLQQQSRWRTARHAFWNHEAEAEVRRLIARERPDVLHCNNLFPQISPSIYRPANEAGIPVVQAIRNYRLFCPAGTLYRDGRVCTDCVGKSFAYPAVLHGCYRDSRPGSAVLAGMNAYHRYQGTWTERVDAFFTPSETARTACADAHFPTERMHVRTNFVYPDLGPGEGRGRYAIFAGRLSREKGTDTLTEAWLDHDVKMPLKIVGGGDAQRLTRIAEQDARIEVLGWQPVEKVLELIGEAACLIFTSRWYETFGRSIAEAFSRGTPVVASDLGAMRELIRHEQTGYLFPPGDAAGLARQVERVAAELDDQASREAMRKRCREEYLSRFTRLRSYQQLLTVYEAAGVAGAAEAAARLETAHV